MSTGQQFNRIASLIVANTNLGAGRDLSQLHFSFRVEQADVETPDVMTVRVYNLNDQTENEVISQYDTIALQAGYVGTGLQTLFVGQIKAFKRGKENSTDRFLEISAAAADVGYNFGFVSQTFAKGARQADVLAAAAAAMGAQLDPAAESALTGSSFGNVLPRGKVQFGLSRIHLRQLTETAGARWFIDSKTNMLRVVANSGYLPGTVVVLSPDTGLIGQPEATTNGIVARCLMNPYLAIGQRIQIVGSSITSVTAPTNQSGYAAGSQISGVIQFPSRTGFEQYAAVQAGLGIYRAVVIELSGDTREQDWYSNLTCLTVDPSASPSNSVPVA